MDERAFRKSSNFFRDLQGSRRSSFEDVCENQLFVRGSFSNNELVKSLFTLLKNNIAPGQIPFP